MKSIINFLDRLAEEGKLHKFMIYACDETPYLTRYSLKKTALGRLRLHYFHKGDEDKELHDHPWPFVSLILWNGYIEQTDRGRKRVWPGMVLIRPSRWTHRVELLPGKKAATLVWTGKENREWGFHTEKGWMWWRHFLKSQGCAEEQTSRKDQTPRFPLPAGAVTPDAFSEVA